MSDFSNQTILHSHTKIKQSVYQPVFGLNKTIFSIKVRVFSGEAPFRLPRDYPNQLQTALIYNDFLHYTLRLLPIYCFLEFRYEINNQKQSCREAPSRTVFLFVCYFIHQSLCLSGQQDRKAITCSARRLCPWALGCRPSRKYVSLITSTRGCRPDTANRSSTGKE